MNNSSIGFVGEIENLTLQNSNYRHVIYTSKHMQLVLMVLKPGEEIGMEVHEGHDQFFRIEEGEVTVLLGSEEHILKADMVLIVPAGVQHNVINKSAEVVKLYTIYAPPQHPAGTLQERKPVED